MVTKSFLEGSGRRVKRGGGKREGKKVCADGRHEGHKPLGVKTHAKTE